MAAGKYGIALPSVRKEPAAASPLIYECMLGHSLHPDTTLSKEFSHETVSSWTSTSKSSLPQHPLQADQFVAAGAEGDQVFFRVLPLVAARSQVMDLEIVPASTILAAPSVPPQYLLAQFFIQAPN